MVRVSFRDIVSHEKCDDDDNDDVLAAFLFLFSFLAWMEEKQGNGKKAEGWTNVWAGREKPVSVGVCTHHATKEKIPGCHKLI